MLSSEITGGGSGEDFAVYADNQVKNSQRIRNPIIFKIISINNKLLLM